MKAKKRTKQGLGRYVTGDATRIADMLTAGTIYADQATRREDGSFDVRVRLAAKPDICALINSRGGKDGVTVSHLARALAKHIQR